MEREADRVGFGVLTGAGFDGLGFVSMFDKMQQSSRYDDGSFPYLRSHPLTGERIADMRSRVPAGPAAAAGGQVGPIKATTPDASGATAPAAPLGLRLDLPGARGASSASVGLPMPSRSVHVLVSARARVLAENGPDRQRAWLANGRSANASPGDRYAAALSALRLGQRDLALELAQQLRTAVAPEARPTVDALLLDILLSPVAGGVPSLPPAQAALLAELRDQALAGTSRASALLGAQAALRNRSAAARGQPLAGLGGAAAARRGGLANAVTGLCRARADHARHPCRGGGACRPPGLRWCGGPLQGGPGAARRATRGRHGTGHRGQPPS
ncbi:hypothetical protein ACFJGX_06025 [Hydrogenophaga sp. UC242_50]|uniref:hypothetical protein n=1 Tax=Hydrogenophaga sp. UC242_50 TaxID=3350169 RepID=UPI0036D382C7